LICNKEMSREAGISPQQPPAGCFLRCNDLLWPRGSTPRVVQDKAVTSNSPLISTPMPRRSATWPTPAKFLPTS